MKKKILALLMSICIIFPSFVMDVHADEMDADAFGMGYIPMEDEIPEVFFEEKNAEAYSIDGSAREAAVVLPRTYRSDTVIGLPAMRSQGQYETCWAFSALGACEASLISKGAANSSIDLSESHLAYFFYNKAANVGDKFKNTVGDYNRTAIRTWSMLGGNAVFTMWHLASWAGPISEGDATYSYSNIASLDAAATNDMATVYGSDAAHVQNVMIIPLSYRDDIKKAIMEQGAIGASYHAPTNIAERQAYDGFAAGKDTGDEGSFYCSDALSTNHAIQIVGWDDDYAATNFVTNPGSNGAWLIKNSWGEESDTYAQNGYFWMSYLDKSLTGAYVYDCEPANNYDNIYQYDGASYAASVQVSQAANVFEASDTNGVAEALEAVSIGLAQADVNYTVDIYLYPTGSVTSPTAGTKVHSQNGYIKYPGYYTIPLSKEIQLEKGQKFGVVFRFANDTKVYIDYSATARDSKGVTWAVFMTEQQAGQSFARTSSSLSDADMALQKTPKTMRIKAFSSTLSTSDIWIDQELVSMKVGESYQLKIHPSGRSLTYSSSSPEVASVSGGVVKALKTGTTTITITDTNGKQLSCVVNVQQGTAVTPTVAPNVVPAKVSGVKAKKTSSGIKITYKKANNATGYEIYRSKKKTSKGSRIASVKTKTAYTDKKVKNKKGTYYYRVRAYRTINGVKKYGAFSKVVKVNVK